MKALYYRTALDENNFKKCRSILKEALGKINDKSSYPQILSITNKSIPDKVQIAEGFKTNSLISSHNVPMSSKCFSSYIRQPQTHSFFLGPVTPLEV